MFDSGVGGVSVLREIRTLLPHVDTVYLADAAWAPYGEKSLADLRRRATDVAGYLIRRGASVVVVACNTASAAALHHLRRRFADTPFVGMEPAVKPAAARSHTRLVGVIGTAATFQGELFAGVVDRFGTGVEVIARPCPGLADLIEREPVDAPATEEALRRHLEPLLERGIDTLVLACTHYSFLTPAICRIAGDSLTVIDPAPAVARQVRRVLAREGYTPSSGPPGAVTYVTTGEVARLSSRLPDLVAGPWPVERVSL